MTSLWWPVDLWLESASMTMKEVLIATNVGFLQNRTAAQIGEGLPQ